ncbi:MAG: hypothetical protein EGQ20_08730 [Bacteroides oleiciplenus]|nr:hypothetical protein [Bacteroides oleiciplenus]
MKFATRLLSFSHNSSVSPSGGAITKRNPLL